jgi:hypothetical protein
MRIERSLLRRLAGTFVCTLALSACGGGSETSPGDTAQIEVSRSTTRLEGDWLLTEFQPVDKLEPMFAALLAAQMGQLKVTLRAGTMHVEGVGVSADRTFRVTQAAADGFSAVMIDPNGVQYRITGAFQGTDLAFVSQSDPWRGNGRLRRLP